MVVGITDPGIEQERADEDARQARHACDECCANRNAGGQEHGRRVARRQSKKQPKPADHDIRNRQNTIEKKRPPSCRLPARFFPHRSSPTGLVRQGLTLLSESSAAGPKRLALIYTKQNSMWA